MVRLRHEKTVSRNFFSKAVEQRNIDKKTTMNRTESSHQVTTSTSTKPHTNFNVIESLQEYNRLQINKIRCIENDTIDHDVDGKTHGIDVPQQSDPVAITKTVSCVAPLFACRLFIFKVFFFNYFCVCYFRVIFVFMFLVEKIPNLLRMGANANEFQWSAHRDYWRYPFEFGDKRSTRK